MTTIRTLYPEDRRVPVETVIGWAWDRAIDDAEADAMADRGRPLSDEEHAVVAAAVQIQSLDEAIAILEDAGTATFAADSIEDGA